MTRDTARFSVGKCPSKMHRNSTARFRLLSREVSTYPPQNVDHSTLRQELLNKVWYRAKADDLSLHSVDDDGHVISDSPIKRSLNSGTSRTPDVR